MGSEMCIRDSSLPPLFPHAINQKGVCNMREHNKSESTEEEIVILTDENGVEHRVVPVLTARSDESYYFYFYEEDDSNQESPALLIMKLLSTAEDGTEKLIPLDDAEWEDAAAIYDEAIGNS